MGFLSYIQSFFTTPEAPKKQYNLLTKKGSNHFSNVPNFSEFEANPISFSFDDEHDFTNVFLTEEQAKHLFHVVPTAGDHFEEDAVITLPTNRYFPLPEATISAAAVEENVGPTATPGVLLDIPRYTGAIRGIDVAILDTLMVTTAPQLKPFKVTVEKSYVGETPCESHATNVAEIIAQGFDPKKTDLQFKNFAVFDCNGSTTNSTLVNALQAILAYKKGAGKNRQLVVNFSGGGATSPMLDTLFAKLTKQGIAVVVASGNSAQVCTLGSPANVSSSSTLQSIGALAKKGDPVGYKAGQDISTYSNYATPTAKCVDEHYQGCYVLPDPFTGKASVGCGTSFAAPVGTIRRVVAEATHPKATGEQIKQMMQSNTIPAIGPEDVVVNAITPAMAFNWNATQKQSNGTGSLAAGATGGSTPAVAKPEVKSKQKARI